jgi:hypothetical protein
LEALPCSRCCVPTSAGSAIVGARARPGRVRSPPRRWRGWRRVNSSTAGASRACSRRHRWPPRRRTSGAPTTGLGSTPPAVRVSRSRGDTAFEGRGLAAKAGDAVQASSWRDCRRYWIGPRKVREPDGSYSVEGGIQIECPEREFIKISPARLRRQRTLWDETVDSGSNQGNTTRLSVGSPPLAAPGNITWMRFSRSAMALSSARALNRGPCRSNADGDGPRALGMSHRPPVSGPSMGSRSPGPSTLSGGLAGGRACLLYTLRRHPVGDSGMSVLRRLIGKKGYRRHRTPHTGGHFRRGRSRPWNRATS